MSINCMKYSRRKCLKKNVKIYLTQDISLDTDVVSFIFLSVLFKTNPPAVFRFFYHAHSIDALRIRRELGL